MVSNERCHKCRSNHYEKAPELAPAIFFFFFFLDSSNLLKTPLESDHLGEASFFFKPG